MCFRSLLCLHNKRFKNVRFPTDTIIFVAPVMRTDSVDNFVLSVAFEN